MGKMRIITSCLGLITSLLLTSPVSAATLALSPVTSNVGQGCSFAVGVVLNTQSVDTDSSDVILTYDPQQFTAGSVVNGTIFNDYPGNSIDNQTGRVSIYALASQNTVFNGSGTVATVNFTASSSATLSTHPINFDFDPLNPTKTTDSNVIQKGTTTDILKSVTNGNFTVNANGCNNQAVAIVAQGQTNASSSAQVSTLPGSGTFSTTLTVIVAGLGLIVAGLLGLSYNNLHDPVRTHH